jgi:hypothetical protein
VEEALHLVQEPQAQQVLQEFQDTELEQQLVQVLPVVEEEGALHLVRAQQEFQDMELEHELVQVQLAEEVVASTLVKVLQELEQLEGEEGHIHLRGVPLLVQVLEGGLYLQVLDVALLEAEQVHTHLKKGSPQFLKNP